MDIESVLDDSVLDAAEESQGFATVPAGTYKMRVISPKLKIIERNGIRSMGISLAPVATEDGEAVNGESIYHTLPLEGEFQQKKKDGTTITQSRSLFFATFFRKGLELDRDDVKAVFATAIETPVGEHAQLKLANGEYLDVAGKELMGKVTVTESNGKEYRNVRSVWAIAE